MTAPAVTIPAALRLRGYRAVDLPLLSGDWLPGELLGLPVPGRPALADPASVPPPSPGRGLAEEVLVLPETAFVRFSELDWVHRRARLEIGLRPGAAAVAGPLLRAALAHAHRTLNLRRVYGWFTPGAAHPHDAHDAPGRAAAHPRGADDAHPHDPRGGERPSAAEELLRSAGLSPEADVPQALWLDGRPVDRQIWGVFRHD
ncbi:hypothetical protein VSR01_33565 [Actinacidiphila sp. DG2A-62]|uniref:hypothetical protein n=1 Tax=Actinacidiphila sp. DG2A-62 TaxID=3108821 RepID=UPI002DB751F3|nr:hypothetical protein [Actinacidiphila sp. DG2A-62]MEC3998154.1 hypothetical protein [Actinacidiphila sp. DG2A-62]